MDVEPMSAWGKASDIWGEEKPVADVVQGDCANLRPDARLRSEVNLSRDAMACALERLQEGERC